MTRDIDAEIIKTLNSLDKQARAIPFGTLRDSMMKSVVELDRLYRRRLTAAHDERLEVVRYRAEVEGLMKR